MTDAQLSLDSVDALHERISSTTDNTRTAEQGLDALLAMSERLQDQGNGIELANQRVDQLIDLKDRALANTGNLASATENLELMMDVHDQLAKIALSFGRMRHWVTEIVAFEPIFNRAMRSLQPLTELGNLRNLNAGELRQVIRTMNDRHTGQLAVSPEGQPATSDSAANPSQASDLPAIDPPAFDSAVTDSTGTDSSVQDSAAVQPVIELARAK